MDRWTDGQMDRWIDKEIEQTDRQTDKPIDLVGGFNPSDKY